VSIRNPARLTSALGIVLLFGLAAGCRQDMVAWRTDLAKSNAQRLEGLWEMRLRVRSPASDTLQPRFVTGVIALTLNEEGLSAPGFGEPPMVFGTYDIGFEWAGVYAGAYAGIPSIVGRMRGDSVELKLAPDSKLPIELWGILREDSISGRWYGHRRAGFDRYGDFVLRRR
jgi:hypothetical protein